MPLWENGMAIDVAGKWKPPRGAWGLKIGGILAPGTATLYPDGKNYEVKCLTLCGTDTITLEGAPAEQMTGAEFARRVQLAGSIQHVMRKGCYDCREQYLSTTLHEQQWLTATAPQLGPIIGVLTPQGLSELAGM